MRFDLFVIGGGSGGIACARRAAALGARVGLAEPGRLGGTCVIRGCVPKKLMYYAAQLGRLGRLGAGYGWRNGAAALDFARLLDNRDREIARLEGVYERMLERAGVVRFRAPARLTGAAGPPHEVEVAGERHLADHVAIAVGARPSPPELPGIELAVTSDHILEGHYPFPGELVVIGAGYIGIELASIFRCLGARVRLVYRRDLPLFGFDEELRREMAAALEQAGIELCAEMRPVRILRQGDRLAVETDRGAVEGELVICATGRKPRPNTRGLGLEALGVRMRHDGTIYVNAHYGASVPGVHAVGDCADHAGNGMDPQQHDLTPVAIAEGRALAETLFGAGPRTVRYDTVPTAVFGLPQAASVGLSEERARALGLDVEIYRGRFRPMLFTLPEVEARAFVKLVVDRADGRVVGLHMVGEEAAEIVQGFAVAMTAGATKADFDATVALHPTLAEEFVTLYEAVRSTRGEGP